MVHINTKVYVNMSHASSMGHDRGGGNSATFKTAGTLYAIKNNKMKRIFIFLTILLICFSDLAISQNSNILKGKVENIIEKYRDSLRLVGMSVSIIQNNEVVFKKSYGYANIELNVPMTDSSVYRVWSVSKQFCAVSVIRLEKQGLLKPDDPVSKYLDSIPQTWKQITIQQLLNHTSGIKDYFNDFPEGNTLHGRDFKEIADSAAVLKFKPGSNWSYSNTGYWVLSKIVGKITGKPYQDYLHEVFFAPLQMSNTRRMDYFNIVKNRVNGYQDAMGVLQNSTRKFDELCVTDGDAELMSAINDLTSWTKSLFSGKVIELNTLEKAWDFAKNNKGIKVNASDVIYYDPKASYGSGWFISELQGHKIVWTPGAGIGFSNTVFSVPDLKLSIIVLCNDSRFLIADIIAREIASNIIRSQ
jgi:CubicO group peptidase (beta-lactamase class C family)